MLGPGPEVHCEALSDDRRYRLLGCLGEGGFGVVYRARMEGSDGFVKDVAVKLIRDADAPESVIARFRDEARILGLLRDRAIVGVDPPVRLGGQWALVMEFVDGVSCARLLRDGPIPARVALEVVAELARVLDVAWRHPGPDGLPLQLLHRDLKPANVQLTPTGQVKLLDLGIARAQFTGREAQTTHRLAGTPGYIAPERLQGLEGPEGDVYSLGVLLHELITGVRRSEHSAEPTFEVDLGDAVPEARNAPIELARAMRSRRPSDRPTAREVEAQALELAREQGGPSLRDWAEERVPSEPEYLPSERVGSVLTASLTSTRPQEPAPARSLRGLVPVALVVAVALAVGAWMRFQRPVSIEDALVQPFADFVMEADAAISERSHLRNPAAWDRALFDATRAHVERTVGREGTFGRLDQVWQVWRDVTVAARAAGLPEVVAGIPWGESLYQPELQSSWCAKGLWQLMPETAYRARAKLGVDLELRDCQFTDEPGVLWSPTDLAPSRPLVYVREGACRIPARLGCAVDDRTDVAKSTAAALALLRSAWEDPEIRASGGVVQLTLASHFVGFDDAAFSVPHPANVLPAYREWAPGVPDAAHPHFLNSEGTQLDSQAADLVARALAAHFVAVCYYALNYADEPAFRDWRKYREGYCRALDIPTRAQVAF